MELIQHLGVETLWIGQKPPGGGRLRTSPGHQITTTKRPKMSAMVNSSTHFFTTVLRTTPATTIQTKVGFNKKSFQFSHQTRTHQLALLFLISCSHFKKNIPSTLSQHLFFFFTCCLLACFYMFLMNLRTKKNPEFENQLDMN